MSTMPSKGRRRIEVDGTTFNYVLKGGKGRYRGDSGPAIRLIVELTPNMKYLSTTLVSKNFDDDAEMGLRSHKVAVTPQDVAEVVRAALANEGALPRDFDLPLWRVAPPLGA